MASYLFPHNPALSGRDMVKEQSFYAVDAMMNAAIYCGLFFGVLLLWTVLYSGAIKLGLTNAPFAPCHGASVHQNMLVAHRGA